MKIIKCRGCDISTKHPPKEFFRNRTGNEAWLLMCFNTDFLYYYDKGLRRGGKYQCLINAPRTPIVHGPAQSMAAGFENDWIYFEGEGIEALIKELELPVGISFDVAEMNCLTTYISKIKNEENMPMHYSEYYISQLIYAMLIHTARQRKISDFKNNQAYETITRARRYMIENSEKKITLKQISEYAGYSVSRFCELYKQYFDSSPITDLINARIDKAKLQLLSSSKSIGEIAYESGFDSIHYFSNLFKRTVGCSPSEYRRKK